jgi:hypothetical protein
MKGGKISNKFCGIFSISLGKEISVTNGLGGFHPTKKIR